MSRVAKNPVQLPAGVEANVRDTLLTIKGVKGTLEKAIPTAVKVEKIDNTLQFKPNDAENADAIAGAFRAQAQNMVTGVTNGFERKLVLVGVGYRAAAQGNQLSLTLGHSHPVVYQIPAGIKILTPSQTEITVQGIDKQLVGQVAAEIRAYRSPEPYKGKGVKYIDEVIIIKEAKKK